MAYFFIGDGFAIREFHEELLKYGLLPLHILEEVVDDWIANKRSLARGI